MFLSEVIQLFFIVLSEVFMSSVGCESCDWRYEQKGFIWLADVLPALVLKCEHSCEHNRLKQQT